MAKRRMVSVDIINSDSFMDMPLSSQALYIHLLINADDDGFNNNAKMIVRMIQAKEKDLELLISKKFIIMFDSGIVVIKHWKMQNTIRSDRYKQTNYQEEMEKLITKQNGSYSLLRDKVDNVIPNDNQSHTVGTHRLVEVSIGKSSLVKENNNKKYFDNSEVNESFIEFLNLRLKLKAKNTDRSIKLLINKLLPFEDSIKITMIENSIMNSWKGVFDLKQSNSKVKPKAEEPSWLEGHMKEFEEKHRK